MVKIDQIKQYLKKLNRKSLIILGIVLTGISVLFVLIDLGANTNTGLVQSIRLYFSPIVVQRGSIRAQILFPGIVDFSEHAVLEFQQIPTNGVLISWIGVKAGDYVKKDQLLATLDTQMVQKQQEINLSNYLNQRYTFDQTVNSDGGRSPQTANNDTEKVQLEQNQISLNNTVFTVELQDLVKRFSSLYTPIEGIVTKIDIPYAGVNIQSADQEKFEVINPKTMFFNADVDETEVNNLHVGDKGVVLLNALPTEYLEAAITNIAFAPHQDANNNTVFTVKLELTSKTNKDYRYKYQMAGYVIFHEYSDNVLYIPNTYLHTDDNGTYVKVGDARKLVYIQPGITDGKVTEVIKGINEGDKIYY